MNRITILTLLFLLSATVPIFPESLQEEPLGDVARALRAEKEKRVQKPVKVFTNDNLPGPNPLEAVSQSPAAPDDQSANHDQKKVKRSAQSPTDDSASPQSVTHENKMKTRDYWQARLAAARSDMEKAREQEQLGEDELNLLEIQQVRELNPTVKADLSAQVQAKRAEVEVNKLTTEAAQKALAGIDNEFKQSGAPDDWSQSD
jgi:hypothetical protein